MLDILKENLNKAQNFFVTFNDFPFRFTFCPILPKNSRTTYH